MGFRRGIGLLFLLLTWATPTVGFALQGESSVANSFPPDGGPARTIVLGGANANRVTLDIDPTAEQYVVTDAAGITAGEDCTAGEPADRALHEASVSACALRGKVARRG